tara:strand:+ start:232 stop:867 length:636 start_codon:yes stop_codon:yes gene_type:complete
VSKTKTIEGVEYILKEHVDSIISQRISKYSEKLTAAESRIEQYQTQLDEVKAKSGLVDNLTEQMATMKTQLEQANSRYDRHTVISQHGITDSSIRDAIEWAYDRQMDSIPSDQRTPLGEWLTQMNEKPESAPAFLQPFFNKPSAVPPSAVPPSAVPPSAVPSNAGVQNSEQLSATDVLSRAQDPDFYMANRERVKEAVYNSLKSGSTPFKF